ncbi:MAG: hypothetical protein P8J78_11525 [Maricaulis sp.]|nr:hypothetical protein [Maricaulis sp.]MDG2045231.1 hypothetical protein [Maricaulis sp.]
MSTTCWEAWFAAGPARGRVGRSIVTRSSTMRDFIARMTSDLIVSKSLA